ncbi:MAG: BppU family phage baseplate upper protein [Nitrospirae bacterium]|nr:BppU family phage baseplate upper protein [Nitrospirota bacterium]
MSSTYQFVAGDTGSKLKVTCKNDADNSIIDLTGATVKLKWKDSGGALQTKTMTVLTPATNGQAEYQFASGELFAGTMNFEVEITDAGSKVIRCLDLIIGKVRELL